MLLPRTSASPLVLSFVRSFAFGARAKRGKKGGRESDLCLFFFPVYGFYLMYGGVICDADYGIFVVVYSGVLVPLSAVPALH